MNGFELYGRLSRIDGNMKNLFLSADNEHYGEYIKQFPASESRKYLHKPVRMNQLLKQVEEILKPVEKKFKELEYVSINSVELRIALDKALSVAGKSVKDSVIKEMEREGIVLDGKASYSSPQIERVLQKIVGNDASSLLMTGIIKELRK